MKGTISDKAREIMDAPNKDIYETISTQQPMKDKLQALVDENRKLSALLNRKLSALLNRKLSALFVTRSTDYYDGYCDALDDTCDELQALIDEEYSDG